jgi:hypothetical protein
MHAGETAFRRPGQSRWLGLGFLASVLAIDIDGFPSLCIGGWYIAGIVKDR